MAKWGEGDPRWLVEDRPDATNVNNWHWTEKNASLWSKNKLNELLVGLKWTDEIGTCEITEMSRCEGDAAVNNRKAKLIFIYEWAITLKWKGTPSDGDVPVTGNFDVLNLSEEHEIEDVDVVVTMDKPSPNAEKFKEYLRIKGTEKVKAQLTKYLKYLREEFSKGVILPTKGSINDSSVQVKKIETTHKKQLNEIITQNDAVNHNTIDTEDLRCTETFKCRAEDFYMVLTKKEMVQAFTNSDCVINAVDGGLFELYGGNVQGQFIELVPNKLIKQKWRFKSWPAGHFSDVIIEIKENFDSTEVNITQKGIPKSEVESTAEGWKRYYWESIKRTFGFGVFI